VGYIEAKAPTTKDLDAIESTEQLKRYLHTFPNIILTNFLEFRLYRNGIMIALTQIARPFVIHKLKTIPPTENESDFSGLLEKFLSFSLPKVYDARTPEAVVSYIVRSLHHILKQHFKRPDGLAGGNVTVLDPAAGTLTFLAEAAKLATEEFVSRYGEGAKTNFIKEHVLRNFYAFELMMAPYAVGHLKMSFLLEELGYKLQKDDRFKLYLTNTVEMEELAQSELPGMASLSEGSHLAAKVKKETPILVILGNPPYSGHSANKGRWIDDLLKN
jgi:hypothetical protein